MTNKREAISKKLRFEVFKRDSFTCQYCGRSAPDVILELDHINPINNGGGNNILNLITSCKDCNRGKSDRLLSDDSVIKKQQEQLKELNERREQLKLLLDWKKELETFDDEQVKEIEKLLSVTGHSFSEHGKKERKKFIKKFGFEEVYESTKISIAQYFKEDDNESIAKTFNYIGKICQVRKIQKKNPLIANYNYLKAVLRNRFNYLNENQLRIFCKDFKTGKEYDDLIEYAKISRNWTEFKQTIEKYLEEKKCQSEE